MDTNQDQVNPQGNQDQSVSLGWRSALPDEFKEHEFVKDCQKPGDFVKRAIDTKAELDALQAKMANSIPKLPENPTPEQVKAFKDALGVPEKAEAYEFKPAEGVTHSPEMVAFARDIFFKAGLNQEQAEVITQGWDAFMSALEKGQADAVKAAKEKAEADLKKELGDQFNETVALSQRLWAKHMGQEFNSFLEETKLNDGTALGNHPLLIRFFSKLSRLTGEDKTPPGTQIGTKGGVPGMNYNKSPAPPPKS